MQDHWFFRGLSLEFNGRLGLQYLAFTALDTGQTNWLEFQIAQGRRDVLGEKKVNL